MNHTVFSQIANLGNYEVQNYSKSNYHAGTQNWDLEFFNDGRLCVANNSGLLLFDGSTWELFKTPKKTIVRSLVTDKDLKRIYIGAQGEFGYFDFNESYGRYVDLTINYSKSDQLEDVWELISLEKDIYFRSNNQIYRYTDQGLETLETKGDITFIQKVQNTLVFNDLNEGLLQLKGNKIVLIPGSSVLKNIEIIDLIELESNQFLILTRSHGIFIKNDEGVKKWKTNCEDFLLKNWINSGHFSPQNGILTIGTFSSGVIFLNEDGKAINYLNTKDGLQSNTITSISKDIGGNLWLCGYYGIDRISNPNLEQWIFPGIDAKSAIYDVEFWNGHIFFATSNGLFYIKEREYYDVFSEREISFFPGTNSECWGLDIIDDQLFLAHNNGGFVIDKDFQFEKLDHDPGVWKYIKLNDDKLLVGSYNGISILKKLKGNWTFSHRIKALNESSRILVLQDDNTLWMTHPYKGIYQLSSKDQFQTTKVTKIDSTWGISRLNNCYGHSFNNSFVVTNEDGIFAFDKNTQTFLPEEKLNKLFENENILRFFNFGDKYWYISNKSAGQIRLETVGTSSRLTKQSIVANDNDFVGGFENLAVHHKNQVYLCTDQGVRYISSRYREPIIQLEISNVHSLTNDSLLFNSINPSGDIIELSSKNNKIRIEFNTTFSSFKANKVLYQSRLIGFSDDWGEWTSSKVKEYNYLPDGEFSFEVRSKSENEQLSEVQRLNFTIPPPFYKSKVALLIYFLLAGLCMYLIVTIPSLKHRKRNTILLEEKNQTEDKNRDLELKNYNIQLEAKNKELAYTTMHLIQHNKAMQRVRDEIDQVKKKTSDKSTKHELVRLTKILKETERREDDWEQFSKHFNQVHHGFLTRLKEKHSSLSAKDLKICSYLRLNLSTKEIAPLLGISIRGVEISRYRLRKKIDLDTKTDLNEYMIKF